MPSQKAYPYQQEQQFPTQEPDGRLYGLYRYPDFPEDTRKVQMLPFQSMLSGRLFFYADIDTSVVPEGTWIQRASLCSLPTQFRLHIKARSFIHGRYFTHPADTVGVSPWNPPGPLPSPDGFFGIIPDILEFTYTMVRQGFGLPAVYWNEPFTHPLDPSIQYGPFMGSSPIITASFSSIGWAASIGLAGVAKFRSDPQNACLSPIGEWDTSDASFELIEATP